VHVTAGEIKSRNRCHARHKNHKKWKIRYYKPQGRQLETSEALLALFLYFSSYVPWSVGAFYVQGLRRFASSITKRHVNGTILPLINCYSPVCRGHGTGRCFDSRLGTGVWDTTQLRLISDNIDIGPVGAAIPRSDDRITTRRQIVLGSGRVLIVLFNSIITIDWLLLLVSGGPTHRTGTL